MKRNISATVQVISFLLLMLLNAVPPAHAQQCSPAGVAGGYGFTITGTLLLPTGAVPLAAVGKALLNTDGGFSATEARSVGGEFADETLKGTFTVNSDCSGTLTADVFESGKLVRTSVFSIVFDDHMKEVRAVQQSLTLPDGTTVPAVITVEGKKTFSSGEQD
jgi:hypothetical protein